MKANGILGPRGQLHAVILGTALGLLIVQLGLAQDGPPRLTSKIFRRAPAAILAVANHPANRLAARACRLKLAVHSP